MCRLWGGDYAHQGALPQALRKTALTIPRVRLKVFADDLQLDQEDCETDILRHFPKAAAAVLRMLRC